MCSCSTSQESIRLFVWIALIIDTYICLHLAHVMQLGKLYQMCIFQPFIFISLTWLKCCHFMSKSLQKERPLLVHTALKPWLSGKKSKNGRLGSRLKHAILQLWTLLLLIIYFHWWKKKARTLLIQNVHLFLSCVQATHLLLWFQKTYQMTHWKPLLNSDSWEDFHC